MEVKRMPYSRLPVTIRSIDSPVHVVKVGETVIFSSTDHKAAEFLLDRLLHWESTIVNRERERFASMVETKYRREHAARERLDGQKLLLELVDEIDSDFVSQRMESTVQSESEER